MSWMRCVSTKINKDQALFENVIVNNGNKLVCPTDRRNNLAQKRSSDLKLLQRYDVIQLTFTFSYFCKSDKPLKGWI